MDDLKTIDFETLQRKVNLDKSVDPLQTKVPVQQVPKPSIPAHLFCHTKQSSQGHLAIKSRRCLVQTQDKAIADEAARYLNSLKSKSWVEGYYRNHKAKQGKVDLGLELHNRSEVPDRGKSGYDWNLASSSKSSSNSKPRANQTVFQSRPNSPRRKHSNMIGNNLQRKFNYTFDHSPRLGPSSQNAKLQNSSSVITSGLKTPMKTRSRDMSRSTLNNISRLIESIGYH